jgi:protein-disulfide isomerase
MSTRFLKREIIRSTYLIALAAVLVGADFAYFNNLEDPATPEEAAPAQTVAAERAETAARSDSDPACQLDPTKGPVSDWQSLVNMQDPMQGTAGADVTVIEYFDPNCPHCKDFHEAMKPIVDEYEDEVHFVYKPFPLRSTSLPEVEALYAAAQQGKFFEMLTAQFARQSRGGIVEQDLREIAPEIGMKADVLMTKVNQKKYRSYIVQQRQRAIQMGVNSTPTVLVNGHFVRSRSPECMRQFIERAKNGDLGAS